MASFDYRLNPLYSIKECSSCGALYTTDYCCSKGILRDMIICDLDKTPNLSQRSPQNYPKCGNPVDGQYCQVCALLRKKFKEDLFTYCIENEILQDSSEPSSDDTNVVNALQEPFVVNQDPGKNSSQSPPQINHNCCYGCGDPLEDIFFHHCTCELCGKGAHFSYNCPLKVPISLIRNPSTVKPLRSSHQLCQVLIQHATLKMGIHSLFNAQNDLFNSQNKLMEQLTSMCDMVGQFIQKKEEEKQIEEEQAAKTRYWKIPTCYNDDDDDDYTIAITHKEPDNSLSIGDEHLDTILATKSDEFIKSSVENLIPNPSESEGEHEYQSFFDEDISKEIYSNPLFDEEIISMKIDPHHFNAESDLIESLLNHDSLIISSSSSSSKIDYLFDEFAGELTLLKSISPRINETDHEEETRFYQEIVDSDSLMKEIDLSFTLDDPMPPALMKMTMTLKGIFSSLMNCLAMIPFHFLKMSHFILISLHPLVLLQNHRMEKSPDLLSHLGHEAFQPSAECPMMIYGKNTPILDVLSFHFYPH
uniref:CCHC-type domain-containing protein n=1 Tax=Tanacetum cinerariifolium TaxID=118510 RepID=A0A6L2J5C8_TANCI|nr:hypothetical protein [Tanacetum cinerariifolium]